MADRDQLVAWARMIVSMLEETELWDDVYVAIAGHLTLREIFSALVERELITEEEARELGIHPDAIAPPVAGIRTRPAANNVVPMRRN
jgi:hypothetical protein